MEAGKFLCFMITQRGVEANQDKCEAVLKMTSLGCVKDVQRLTGKLTTLSRFLGASAEKALPFFNLMKKGIAFEWTPACEEAFSHFKKSHSHHFHFHTNCFTNTIHTETKSSKNKTIFFFFKPSSKFQSLTTQARLASSIHPLSPPPPSTNHAILDSKHTTLLVEAYHVHRGLGILLRKLDSIDGDPLRILTEDGDWPKEYFWAVVKFLKNASRFSEILQVFDMWKNIEKLRISELKYNKIISLLVEGGMMEGAMSILQEMKIHGLKPSLDTYNPIIHGFSREGKFGEALCFLDEMKEFDLEPDTETYDGLIRAYGKFKMYDEIAEEIGGAG
ncbi:uncharacterized protein [Arachis hypogaea]|uniref:uncharacterized protein n=1 Tax=Arachis hypogaea TaxID=3818 RepID=UPI003B20C67F